MTDKSGRLTIVGGGGFRVPLIVNALGGMLDDHSRPANSANGAPIGTVVLHDSDDHRLRVISAVLAETTGRRSPRVLVESDLDEALRGADVVFSAIRVGGLRGRICDERAALSEGVLGQETVGAGGVCFALRTVPVARRIAEAVKKIAPDAWLINFTNPAGLVTEAMSSVVGDRVIGICDSPAGLFRRVARTLHINPDDAVFDYAGLNHLGWLRAVTVDGRDRLPELLADADALVTIEEGRLFGANRIRELGAIPNEYVHYYLADAPREPLQTRGEFLLDQQERFYAAGAAPGAATRWASTRSEREATYLADTRDGDRDPRDLDGGGYEHIALATMRALLGRHDTSLGGPYLPRSAGLGQHGAPAERGHPEGRLVLNVRNRGGALPGLDDAAVVELPCEVDDSGARPLPTAPLNASMLGLVRAVKATERATIDAAVSGSRKAAVAALASHPLVDSTPIAERIIDRQLAELPELRAVLTRP